MAVPTTTVWPAEPHTIKKLELIRHYAAAWLPILSLGGCSRLAVLDGFCGPGEYHQPDGKRVAGSPVVLLSELLDHRQFDRMQHTHFTFAFVDKDPDRIDHLRAVVAALGAMPPNITVVIRHGSFHEVVPGIVADLKDVDGRFPPILALVDPFGYADVPLSVIADILRHRTSEVIVTFMVDAVNRFLDHDDRAIRDHLIKLLDAEPGEWEPILQAPNRLDALRDLYASKLLRHTDYVRPFRMMSGTRPIYDLLCATGSLKGLQKMKEAMWRVDPVGGCSFADTTATMDTLFSTGQTDTSELRRTLVEQFTGLQPTIEEIERFTLINTDFHAQQIKALTLKPLERAGRLEYIPPPIASARRSIGQYPPGCRVRFL